jgi:hypothetical protein
MSIKFLGRVKIVLFFMGLLIAFHRDALSQGLKPGDEVFAVNPSLVLEVSYRTSAHRVIAYRWDIGEKFTVFAAHKEGRRQTACIGGGNLKFILGQFSSLKFRREIDAASAEAFLGAKPGKTWAELVIRDNSELEPFQALITPVEGSSNEALVHIGSSTYAIAMERRAFDLMSSGCKSLAARNVRTR